MRNANDRPSEAVIRGFWDSRKVYIQESELTPEASQKVHNHSPNGFMWGYSGSGPAQLALAILMYFLPEQKAVTLYQDFKNEAIAGLPESDFELSVKWVENWIAKRG